MRDVAAAAGVSAITVSRALAHPDKVSKATRRRVLKAVRELDFVPNSVARSLSSNRTRMLAAIVPNIGNPVYARTIYAMSEALRGHGLHLMLGNSGFSPAGEERILVPFLARRPEAIILHERKHTAAARQLLLKSGIPIVETGDLGGAPLDMLVSYSNADAAAAMTTHLLDRGYRRIAFVSTPVAENPRHMQRRAGFLRALRGRGIEPAQHLLVEVEFGHRQGAEALSRLADADRNVDAVFFASDVLAVGATFECLRRGWRVPERLAIAGFDDQEIAREAVPPLTTVRIHREEIGRRAAAMLIARLEGAQDGPKIVDVGFELVVRSST